MEFKESSLLFKEVTVFKVLLSEPGSERKVLTKET